MNRRSSKRLLIAGYYGFGNTGDEAILAGMLSDLRRIDPMLEFTVVSGNPGETVRIHGTESVDWRDIESIIEAAERSDLIIVGGGGLFHDYWEADPATVLTPDHSGLSFVSGFPLLASLLGKPCMLYAVGVGPLHTETGRDQTRMAFDRSQVATLRDIQSHELVKSIGVREDLDLQISADPAFNAPSSEKRSADALLRSLDIEPAEPVFGVSLRYWDFEIDPDVWEAELALALDRFLEGFDRGEVLFLPFQWARTTAYENDLAVCRRVWRRLHHRERAQILDRDPGFSLMASVVGRCDFVVAMRLHAAIFALNASVPVVNMAYDPKTSAVMRKAGLEDFIAPPSAWDSRTLLNLLRRAYDGPGVLRRQLSEFGGRMRSQGQRSASLAKALLESPPEGWRSIHHPVTRKFALERNDEVIALNRRLRTLEDTLAMRDVQLEELQAIKSGTGWAFLRMLWWFRVMIAPLDSSREIAFQQLLRAANPRRGMRLLHRLGLPRRMSWEAYAFNRFKHARLRLVGCSDLGSIQWPSKRDLVSVVLPTYNAAEWIGKAIESLKGQSYDNWELIAINDGSTDQTGEILESYADQDARITVFHQDNQQIPRTLSRGFQAAQGEFLTWTSADNLMKPDFLQRLVACLRRHPDWDMIYANLGIIGEDGRPLQDSEWYSGYQTPPGSSYIHLPEDPSVLNVWANNYIGGAFLYRDRVGGLLGRFSPLRFTAEDYDYWMRVNALMNLRHTDFTRPIYDYRFHTKSLTSLDEELGITRDRTKLMVFDDFRRNFYLSPMAWWVEADPGNGSQSLADCLQRRASESGHLWFTHKDPGKGNYPKLWLPKIYLRVVDHPYETGVVPSWVPPESLKVLVVAGSASISLPSELEGSWDLAVVNNPVNYPPRLVNGSVGWVSAPKVPALYAALDIRARQHHLELIETDLERPMPPTFKISIVIPTYRRGEQLKSGLEALIRQKFPWRDFEIVVVNNDPTDEVVEAIISRFRGELPEDRQDHLRAVVCPIPGLSHARNAGISESRGDVICFLDDDAVVHEDWMAWIWEAFESHPELGAVGGKIEVQIPSPRPQWIRAGMEQYWSHFAPDYSEYTEVEHWWQYPWGANWCARRRALMEIGGFRTSYGRQGKGYAGGEEIVAASLLRRLGYVVAIEPRAVVKHHVDPARFTRRHAWQSVLNGRRTWYQIQRDLYLPWEFSLHGAVRRAASGLFGLPVRAIRRSPLVAAAEAVGDLSVLGWRLRDTIARLRKPVVLGR